VHPVLLDPWFHYFVLLLHISAGLFWMGWIVFNFFLMVPVLRNRIPDQVQSFLSVLKLRIRSVVFWLILFLVVTGIHNVYYHGLYQHEDLMSTDQGHRFLVKLGAALVLFAVYFSAPYLTNFDSRRTTNRMVVILHSVCGNGLLRGIEDG
jgi:uncharacterized membrane protein